MDAIPELKSNAGAGVTGRSSMVTQRNTTAVEGLRRDTSNTKLATSRHMTSSRTSTNLVGG